MQYNKLIIFPEAVPEIESKQQQQQLNTTYSCKVTLNFIVHNHVFLCFEQKKWIYQKFYVLIYFQYSKYHSPKWVYRKMAVLMAAANEAIRNNIKYEKNINEKQ